MEWRNTKTGAVIDVKAELGGNWEPVNPPKQPEKPVKKKGTEKK